MNQERFVNFDHVYAALTEYLQSRSLIERDETVVAVIDDGVAPGLYVSLEKENA